MNRSFLSVIWEVVEFLFGYTLLEIRLGHGKKLLESGYKHIWWTIKPIRCVTCKGWFMQGDFWNPWGPGDGPGLACTEECCIKAQKGDEHVGGSRL